MVAFCGTDSDTIDKVCHIFVVITLTLDYDQLKQNMQMFMCDKISEALIRRRALQLNLDSSSTDSSS